jgi:hypothetical protein
MTLMVVKIILKSFSVHKLRNFSAVASQLGIILLKLNQLVASPVSLVERGAAEFLPAVRNFAVQVGENHVILLLAKVNRV